MTNDTNLWDLQIWSFIVTLAIIFAGMMVANLLKRKIALFRNTLIPSAVLGGFVVLLADVIFKALFHHSMFADGVLETLTYHCLGLGFVALSLRHMHDKGDKNSKRDVFNTATITVNTYLLQGIIGLVISIVLFFLVKAFAGAGLLLPLGYGQGPGQAFNWGNIFENQYGFAGGKSFGLSLAAMGFISACVGGSYYLKLLKKNGNVELADKSLFDDELSVGDITEEGEIPMSESMDKLTVQFGLVFMAYGAAYLTMFLIYKFILLPIGGFCMNTINPMIWGFNFLFGAAWAVLFKNFANKWRARGIMHRVYVNNFMLNRISGVLFDVMVVSSIADINLSAFRNKSFWIPLLLMCIIGMVATFWYVKKKCEALFPTYSDEMFLTMYGMLTGTASTGIILLREIDPGFKTPASHNMVYQNLWAIIMGAPIMLLLGVVGKGIKLAIITLIILIVLFAAITFIQKNRERVIRYEMKKQQAE